MDDRQLARALRRGRGSAIVYLQHADDKDRYRDLVLSLCVRDIAYDVQVEGTKGAYLSFAIQALDASDLVEGAIIERFLSGRRHDRLEQQLTDLLACLAGSGDLPAREALRTRYGQFAAERRLRNSWKSSPGSRWEDVGLALLDLEGFVAFRRYVTDIGQYIIRVPGGHDHVEYWSFLDVARRRFGTRRVSAFLDPSNRAVRRTPREQDAITALAAARAVEAAGREASRARGDEPPVTAEWVREWARRAAADGRRYGSIALLVRDRAPAEEQLKLAKAIFEEPDETTRGWMLWAFRRTPFPLSTEPLIPFLDSTDDRLRNAAVGVLGSSKGDAIHEAAVRILQTEALEAGGLALLQSNYHRSDDPVIADAVRRHRKSLPHHIVMELREIYENHRSARALPVLLRAYREGECAYCRSQIVKAMHRARVLPDEILHECQFDSYDETRAFARRLITRRGRAAGRGGS